MPFALSLVVVFAAVSGAPGPARNQPMIRCEVVDAAGGGPLPARVYVRSDSGKWFFARTASEKGSASPTPPSSASKRRPGDRPS